MTEIGVPPMETLVTRGTTFETVSVSSLEANPPITSPSAML